MLFRSEMIVAFEAAYRRRFSFLMPDKPIVVEAVSVEASDTAELPDASRDATARSDESDECDIQPVIAGSMSHSSGGKSAQPAEHVHMFAAGEWARVPLFRRDTLRPGQAVDGPAIIAEDLATTVVEPGWRASVTDGLDLLLTRIAPRPGAAEIGRAHV